MKPSTREALAESIEHWEEIISVKTVRDVQIGEEHCALCHAFPTESCTGCPVAQAADICCHGTPYYDVIKAYFAWQDYPNNLKKRAKFRAEARKELSFLKSIWPIGYPR
jgi:hypothetical protein